MATEWDFQALDHDDEWYLGDVGEPHQSNNDPWSSYQNARRDTNGTTPVPYSSSPLDFATPPRHVNAPATRDRLPSPTRLATGFAAYDTVNFPYTSASTSTLNRPTDTQPEHRHRRTEPQSQANNITRRASGQSSSQDPFAELLRRQLQPREAPAQQWGATDSDNDPADDFSQLQSTASDSEEEMTTASRRQPRRAASNNNGVVDLTQSPTSTPQASTRKRGADSRSGSEPSKKRKRILPTPSAVALDDDEDFANEAPGADDELVSAQQMDALKQQESGRDDGPVKMGKRTCIICLETFTNATVAHCGHIFCHECLTRALMASEKHSDRRIGNCPACRKPINRKKGITTIPINFMKASAFNTKGRGRELNV